MDGRKGRGKGKSEGRKRGREGSRAKKEGRKTRKQNSPTIIIDTQTCVSECGCFFFFFHFFHLFFYSCLPYDILFQKFVDNSFFELKYSNQV